MDGKGRWTDNIFVERLWRSLKYEEVYLKAYQTIAEAKSNIGAGLIYTIPREGIKALGEKLQILNISMALN